MWKCSISHVPVCHTFAFHQLWPPASDTTPGHLDHPMGWDGSGFCSYSQRDVHQQVDVLDWAMSISELWDHPKDATWNLGCWGPFAEAFYLAIAQGQFHQPFEAMPSGQLERTQHLLNAFLPSVLIQKQDIQKGIRLMFFQNKNHDLSPSRLGSPFSSLGTLSLQGLCVMLSALEKRTGLGTWPH